ncbi:YpdA family putative bacillithiol disulfide reductase [Mesonia sp.]|uniref:YpdA family putative bacillithiol disulfide reductase n=1 Tax=Mesonia sp. TaxID=1960830 RepID=UPI00175566F4|nr:YpdA family putative bacillithiol disulfide reductase [Mesonia sp.]HIB38568.1 YpdA family putative bacillithiol disulfide reductase [Mesonia sp.]HIO26895.1 YpdA family putative bacillithiol disulfide reductase [Flavobacteriaceae bacterium]
MLDVVIIGGGPIGIACAIEAQKRNLSYIVIEKGPLVNSLYNYPTNMTFFSSSEKLEIDQIPFISKNAKPSKAEALEYYRRIATSKKLDIHLFENVHTVEEKNDTYQIKTSKDIYTTKNVVIATGFYDLPNRMNVKGEDLPKVNHYYNDPHYYSNQDVIVVGASNSSVDAALEVYRKGGRVTMVVRGKSIGERVKYWVRPDIVNRIEEGSIKAYFNSTIKEIREDEVDIENENGKKQTLKNDFVLALTGYRPNFKFLEEVGIHLQDEEKKIPKYDPQTMETNLKGVYLAGVICGGLETHKWFIENSRIHAKMIMENISSN